MDDVARLRGLLGEAYGALIDDLRVEAAAKELWKMRPSTSTVSDWRWIAARALEAADRAVQ